VERTRLARDLARYITAELDILRQVRSVDPEAEVLVYDLGSGIVAAVNSSDEDQVAIVDCAGRTLELPVGARHFSAWDLETMRYAVVSAEGSVRVDGAVWMTTPPASITVFADGAIEVRPRYDGRGERTTDVAANGAKLDYRADDACGFFAGRAELPVFVEATAEATVRCQATFEQSIEFAPMGDSAMGQYVHRADPDNYRLAWTDAPSDLARLDVQFSWTARSSQRKTFVSSTVAASRTGLIEIDPPTIRGLAAVTVEVRGSDRLGRSVSAPASRLEMTYLDRGLPSMSYAVGNAKLVRILHPMLYENCTIVRVAAEAFSEGRWSPLTLNVGGPGQHARHLQFSEEWQDLFL
jgi:hypothetical protein